MKTAIACLMFFLVSCSSTPRVSTPTERGVALALLQTASIGIEVAYTAGKLNFDQHKAAVDSVTAIRSLVKESENTPQSWADLIAQAEAIVVIWLPYVLVKPQ